MTLKNRIGKLEKAKRSNAGRSPLIMPIVDYRAGVVRPETTEEVERKDYIGLRLIEVRDVITEQN